MKYDKCDKCYRKATYTVTLSNFWKTQVCGLHKKGYQKNGAETKRTKINTYVIKKID